MGMGFSHAAAVPPSARGRYFPFDGASHRLAPSGPRIRDDATTKCHEHERGHKPSLSFHPSIRPSVRPSVHYLYLYLCLYSRTLLHINAYSRTPAQTMERQRAMHARTHSRSLARSPRPFLSLSLILVPASAHHGRAVTKTGGSERLSDGPEKKARRVGMGQRND